MTLSEKLHTMAWHMCPENYYSLQARCKDIAKQEFKGPRAQRPTETYWGDPLPQLQMMGSTAVIPIQGPLVKGATPSDKYYFGVASHEDIHEDITTAVNCRAKNILFNVSSPGGSVLGTEILANRIHSLIESGMPVYMYTGEQCCSAAEFITAACPVRVCTPDAITGSIGTMMQVVTAQKLYEDWGLEFNLFASGKFKGMGASGKSLTPEQKEFLQGFVNDRAREFKSFVTQFRPAVAPEAMQGQIFTGRQACSNGLYDSTVSGIEEALSLLG